MKMNLYLSVVSQLREKLKNWMICYEDFFFSEHMMKKYMYISALKPGCSPGTDGLRPVNV